MRGAACRARRWALTASVARCRGFLCERCAKRARSCVGSNERTNARTNEQTNERTTDRPTVRTNERTNERARARAGPKELKALARLCQRLMSLRGVRATFARRAVVVAVVLVATARWRGVVSRARARIGVRERQHNAARTRAAAAASRRHPRPRRCLHCVVERSLPPNRRGRIGRHVTSEGKEPTAPQAHVVCDARESKQRATPSCDERIERDGRRHRHTSFAT